METHEIDYIDTKQKKNKNNAEYEPDTKNNYRYNSGCCSVM